MTGRKWRNIVVLVAKVGESPVVEMLSAKPLLRAGDRDDLLAIADDQVDVPMPFEVPSRVASKIVRNLSKGSVIDEVAVGAAATSNRTVGIDLINDPGWYRALHGALHGVGGERDFQGRLRF